MMRKPDYERDGIALYCGDCLEILPELSGIDAVVTDPPYGIGETGCNSRQSAAGLSRLGTKTRVVHYEKKDWDDMPCDQTAIDLMRSLSDWQIIFGGNYFTLPPSRCWLIWDKQNSGDFADAEMAWTNLNKAVRLIQWMWNGMIRKGQEQRFHPTQKPLGVMEWCLSHLPNDCRTVLDPYMGSGTTGVACVKTGRQFIGIEKDPTYFAIAVKRIEAALNTDRDSLWTAKELARETQPALFAESDEAFLEGGAT